MGTAMSVVMRVFLAGSVRMAVVVNVHRLIVRGWPTKRSLRWTRYWEI